MRLKVVLNDLFLSNTYIVAGEGEGLIIDPGSSYEMIINIISDLDVEVVGIIATHGHVDHVAGVYMLRKEYNTDFFMHGKDSFLLSQAESFLRTYGYDIPIVDDIDILLDDRGNINIGGFDLRIIHTPGHSPGSISILLGDCLFTGDTLFRESIGRTDFPGGSFNEIVESIHRKIFTLSKNTVIYPGHGPETTVGHEIEYNPFVGRRGAYPFR
jgi:glyoxylase-like metal-dependent hydrolase (beta-lactamase superfamily II)